MKNKKKDRSLRDRLRMIARVKEQGYEVDQFGRLVHREVYKAAHGKIPRDWVVHHLDEIKTNNDISNLIAMPRKLHTVIHRTMHEEGIVLTREQIEAMIRGYKNLRPREEMKVVINVTISYDQIKELPPVEVYISNKAKSGSSTYR